jgi:dipeptidase E
MYLSYWMQESGLAELLPVAARGLRGAERREHDHDPSIGQDFVRWTAPTGGDETLGLSCLS